MTYKQHRELDDALVLALLQRVLAVGSMVGVPCVTRPEASLLHRSNEFLELLLRLIHSEIKRNVPELWIGLVSASEPAVILVDVSQRTDLILRTRLAPDTAGAKEGRNVGVEECGRSFKIAFVVGLVRPLAVWVLVFWVEIAVDSLNELLETELDDSVWNTHTSSCDAVLRVVGGESPDRATAPIVTCDC